MDLDAVGRAKANVQQLLASASATLNVLGPGCITTAFLGATPVQRAKRFRQPRVRCASLAAT